WIERPQERSSDWISSPARTVPWFPTKRLPPGTRSIFVERHEAPEIGPRCPLVDSARAVSKLASLKFASGSVRQESMLMQTDGASTIHSAEEVSIVAARTVAADPRWRVGA